MFTHVMVGANHLAASKKFYDAVLGAMGAPGGPSRSEGPHASLQTSITKCRSGRP
jgi:catechol 2,3-dioxygenase-like lactoylglutathione lyase family enzyme